MTTHTDKNYLSSMYKEIGYFLYALCEEKVLVSQSIAECVFLLAIHSPFFIDWHENNMIVFDLQY